MSRNKRRRTTTNTPADTDQVGISMHTFDPREFLPDAEIERSIQTFVDKTSADGRRVYREIVPIAPPSPIKTARASSSRHTTGPSNIRPTIEIGADERYEMWHDPYDDPPLPQLPRTKKKALFSDPTLYHWKAHLRTRYLWELLRRDGCGDASKELCPRCNRREGATPAYQCRDCRGDLLLCRQCCVARHLGNPLHVIDAWTEGRFVRTSLKALGLRVQFGHPLEQHCDNPSPARQGFVVLHDNTIHEVAVDYCGCEQSAKAGPPDIQLLRGGWYPASEQRPQTCVTLVSLEHFHLQTLQAKTTMYDYYQTLQKLTSNDGRKPPDRYQVFIRICREYRHLMMLKRAGPGHDGVETTKPRELAVLCPACPRPGINLPDGWDSASKEDRLKRGLVSSELKDPGLGTGWAYMTEDVPYRNYLLTVTDQKEMSTCSGLAALDYANTKFSRGYSTTGVGMGVCAQHEFIQPSGVGDLQKGERYANRIIFWAPYFCQWWKQLMARLALLPPLVHCFLILRMVNFVIPKLHIHAHTVLCNILYSLNLIPGSGQTDGEGIERPWANIGGVASSTRIMGPGARHDAIDDHWSFWNWMKLISLADTLRRRLDKAREQRVVQREAFKAFSAEQEDRVAEWKKMVEDYEEDGTNENPYEMKMKGLSEIEVRHQFQQEDEADARNKVPAKHKVTAKTFIVECLDVEEEQRRVRLQAELKKAQTTSQEIDMGALRTKLIRRLDQLRDLQGTYSPASIVALESREAPVGELPENEPLFLPSALSEAERAAGCSEGLVDIEMLLRNAQCQTSLVWLRNQLHIKARFLNYKKLHARHQGANTRSRTIVARNESKIRLHSEKYQAAWNAILAITGGDESKMYGGCGDLAQREEKRKRAVERRKRKYQELIDHSVEVGPWEEEEEDESEDEGEARRGAGESRREISWIWAAAGLSGTDTDLEEALRIEWAKSYARKRRWEEEVRLLEEEFRRLPISLEFEVVQWEKRVKAVPVGQIDEAIAQGMIAYGLKQAALFCDVATRAKATEKAPPVARGKKRLREPLVDPLAEATTVGGIEESEDENEDDDDAIVGRLGDDDDDDERGTVASDEELVMGGEVDDE
ncbi:hypothetical protein C8F04DRAFT_1186481 [Mycena alexandri]|uniref:CxC2-like cysteine cluster KDZ transposase-associated domain-containing protein n=1 Tax=Mycena alexandri TaxID=1745969 RepID=A0AAD6SS72_9AGAR|nr:hypothetical protein C8F04DRAFT_1186481 [Mycena alexandri]